MEANTTGLEYIIKQIWLYEDLQDVLLLLIQISLSFGDPMPNYLWQSYSLELLYISPCNALEVGLLFSLFQQPGPNKFKLSTIEPIYKAKKFKVPPFTI